MKLQNIVFTLLCLLALFTFSCATKSVVDPNQTLGDIYNEVLDVAGHGDWFVVRGTHGPDNFISTVTNAPLSHAAIYDQENNGVIEADSTGVHFTPLAEFLAKSQRLLIIRPIWGQDYGSTAVERARSLIGSGYNYTGLVGVDVPNRYYCTQLVVEAYGPPHYPDNPIPPVIKPSQMYHWGRIIYDSGP